MTQDLPPCTVESCERPTQLGQRFWSKVDTSGDCWTWKANKTHDGYGLFGSPQGAKYAHRVSFEDAVEKIPEGLFLDHTCHTRNCVRPEHLRVVTSAQNGQNQKGPKRTSKTQMRGVYFHKASQKYAAKGQIDGVSTWLGLHETPEKADAVVRAWRRQNMPYSVMDQRPDTGSFFMPGNKENAA